MLFSILKTGWFLVLQYHGVTRQEQRALLGDESDGAEKITTEELEKWKETLAEEEKREEMVTWINM